MSKKKMYHYNSLEDYLTSHMLSVNDETNDGWGAQFPIKGREIYASILFVDMSYFSARSFSLNSTETMIILNHFITWITAEALRDVPAIIDKYIGDEMMIVFSNEFGSKDHFLDAIIAAKNMSENDAFDFCPHCGIASGKVTVGYIGTPLRYNCSVFGQPVTLAKRCASAEVQDKLTATIIFPSELWGDRSFEEVFRGEEFKGSDGTIQRYPKTWEMLPKRKVEFRHLPEIEIQEISSIKVHVPNQSSEERAKEVFQKLINSGCYFPLDPT